MVLWVGPSSGDRGVVQVQPGPPGLRRDPPRMGSPGGVALLSGFGSSATDSLEVGGWMVLPGGNNSTYLGLNQSLPWGVGAGGVDANLSLGSSQAEAVIRAPTMKVSVFYLSVLLLLIFYGFN